MPNKFKIAAATNVGLVRTNNEDNFVVCPDLVAPSWQTPQTPDELMTCSRVGSLLCVADGMGGMNAGEVASAIAVETIKDVFSSSEAILSMKSSDPSKIESFLKKTVAIADKRIKERALEDPASSGMGTTIVLAWIIDAVAHIAWCGDSRAYLFNRQYGLSRLTKDHSYVQQLVDNGELDPDWAFYHPNSNIITRSLGDSPVKAVPDYISKKLVSGDTVLLCSDGLCGICRDDEIMNVMIDSGDNIEKCLDNLIDLALKSGGNDNVTVALYQSVSVEENSLNKTIASAGKQHWFRRWRRP